MIFYKIYDIIFIERKRKREFLYEKKHNAAKWKKKIDYITASNREDGVAIAIEKFALDEK